MALISDQKSLKRIIDTVDHPKNVCCYAIFSCMLYVLVSMLGIRDRPLEILALRIGGFGIAYVTICIVAVLLDQYTVRPVQRALSCLGKISLELYLIHVFLGNITSRLDLFQAFSPVPTVLFFTLRIL